MLKAAPKIDVKEMTEEIKNSFNEHLDAGIKTINENLRD